MNIQQVSKATQLSARQIREYERRGLLSQVQRRDNGYRDYRAQDISRLQFIARARAVGFSFEQISELLALQDNPQRSNSEVKRLTQQHIAELTTQIDQLNQMKDLLLDWQRRCPDNGHTDCPILACLAQPSP